MVKEIVLYLCILSYCEFSKKDLQFGFTLGTSAVSEMKLAANFFFSLQCNLWKILLLLSILISNPVLLLQSKTYRDC